MRYDYRSRKTIITVASHLPVGVAANVIGHLALALGHILPPEEMGQAILHDASGVEHRGISKYPVIITHVKTGRLRKLIEDARHEPGLLLVDYPEEMQRTGHDDELVVALASKPESAMTYLGVALHGPRAQLDALAGKFMLWGKDNPPTNT